MCNTKCMAMVCTQVVLTTANRSTRAPAVHSRSAALLARSLKLAKYARRTKLCPKRFLHLSSQQARCPWACRCGGRKRDPARGGAPLAEHGLLAGHGASTHGGLGRGLRGRRGVCARVLAAQAAALGPGRPAQGAHPKPQLPRLALNGCTSVPYSAVHGKCGWFCCPSSGAPPNPSLL